jgi:hypothetical protein
VVASDGNEIRQVDRAAAISSTRPSSRRLLALLRHANGRWECLFIGGERKSLVGCQTDAKDPNRKSHSFHPIGDALDEVLAPYRAIVSTISIPTCFVTKQAAQQPNLQGGNFWTLIPRLRGLILQAE